jgi:hypothetical protein
MFSDSGGLVHYRFKTLIGSIAQRAYHGIANSIYWLQGWHILLRSRRYILFKNKTP